MQRHFQNICVRVSLNTCKKFRIFWNIEISTKYFSFTTRYFFIAKSSVSGLSRFKNIYFYTWRKEILYITYIYFFHMSVKKFVKLSTRPMNTQRCHPKIKCIYFHIHFLFFSYLSTSFYGHICPLNISYDSYSYASFIICQPCFTLPNQT